MISWICFFVAPWLNWPVDIVIDLRLARAPQTLSMSPSNSIMPHVPFGKYILQSKQLEKKGNVPRAFFIPVSLMDEVYDEWR